MNIDTLFCHEENVSSWIFLIYNHIVSFEALLSRALRFQVNFSFNIIVYFFKSRWKLLFTQGLNSWNPQRVMKCHHRCRSPCLIYTTNSYSTVLICLCFIYTYVVPVLRCQKTQKRLFKVWSYMSWIKKCIGHIGVKQLEQTFFSVKAKESIFFFVNRNPVTVCISVWRSS